MFKIICENCGETSILSFTKTSYGTFDVKISGEIYVNGYDGQVIIECENCGARIDGFNNEIKTEHIR